MLIPCQLKKLVLFNRSVDETGRIVAKKKYCASVSQW